LAGKIFYTTDQPGRWKGKEGGHSPLIKVDKKGGEILIRAATQNGMSKAHYIVKHILLDEQLNYVNEQVFDQAFDMPRSRFELNGFKGRLFIVSMCNLHDNWINWADV
jgi:superoxide reductase